MGPIKVKSSVFPKAYYQYKISSNLGYIQLGKIVKTKEEIEEALQFSLKGLGIDIDILKIIPFNPSLMPLGRKPKEDPNLIFEGHVKFRWRNSDKRQQFDSLEIYKNKIIIRA